MSKKSGHKWKLRAGGFLECSRCNFILIRNHYNGYYSYSSSKKDFITPRSNIKKDTMNKFGFEIINEEIVFTYLDCHTCKIFGICN